MKKLLGGASHAQRAELSNRMRRVRAQRNDDTPSRKRRRRRPWTRQKSGWKYNTKRFKAFEVQERATDGAFRTITVAPETGIHSLQWKENIAPQASPILKLPTEIFSKICFCALSPDGAHPTVSPRKDGLKFFNNIDEGFASPISTYNALTLVSRRFYVEVTGSSLLYRLATFSFTSESSMVNYLSAINPLHKSHLTTISLRLNIKEISVKFPGRAFKTLLALPSLQYLELRFKIDQGLFILGPLSGPVTSRGFTPDRFRINDKVLESIRVNKHLLALKSKGLKDFETRFVLHYTRLSSMFLYQPMLTRRCDYEMPKWDEGKRSHYGEVEDELRALLLSKDSREQAGESGRSGRFGVTGKEGYQ